MLRADGVTDGALRVFAGGAHGFERRAQIADVVERVEDAEHVHAVLGGLIHKAPHHLVFVMPVAQQVLAAQQHLQARVGHQFAERAQALPGIFVQESNAGVEGRAAPALDGPKSRFIEFFASRHQIFQGHARGHQALMGVAQNKFGDLDSSFRHKFFSR